MSRLACTGCGGRVEVPAGHSRAKIRCGDCGYYTEVPDKLRNAEPAEEPEEPKETKKAAVKAERAPPAPLLVGSQDEDDNLPYGVPGDLTRRCESCFREIDYDATLCIHCGTDFAAKTKKKKTYEPIDRKWIERFPVDLRLKVFAGCQVLNLLLAVWTGSIAGGFMFFTFQAAMQAFILGTFNSIHVERTSKGSATITTRFHLCFFPTMPKAVPWKESAGVGIIAIHQPGFLEWITFIYLLLCGIVPGVIFYFLVIRPDRFHIALCDIYGSTNEILFRTTQHSIADEIAKTINTATGLWYKPVL